MSIGSEESIEAQAYATVMIYDDVYKKWLPAGSSSGVSTVMLLKQSLNNTYRYRVVGRKVIGQEVVINCPIQKGLRYHQANQNFHQWRDNRQIFGLNFAGPEGNNTKDGRFDAERFADAMLQAVDFLNGQQAQTNIDSATVPSNKISTVSSYSQSTPPLQQQQQQQSAKPQMQHQSSYGNGSSVTVISHHNVNGAAAAGNDRDNDNNVYSRGSYAHSNSTEDHYGLVQDFQVPSGHVPLKYSDYLQAKAKQGRQMSNDFDQPLTAQPVYTSTAFAPSQPPVQPSSQLSNPHSNHLHVVSSAPTISNSDQTQTTATQNGPPRAPPPPAAPAAVAVPVAAAAPPPPPPPPIVSNGGIGAQNNPLANALQNAQLRRTSKDSGSVSQPVSSGTAVAVGAGSGGKGGGSTLIDEMQATLARRRAKQDRGDDSIDSAAPTNKSLPSAFGDRKASQWEKPENGVRSLSISKAPSSIAAVNGNAGAESPKNPRKASSFTAIAEPDLSRLSGSLDSETLNSELDRWKQEILAEMRKEFNEMKLDLLKAIRQELNCRR